MKVYIEDEANPETTINGVPCRKLGFIKNNETKTFEIDEKAAKLFVIVDALSKNYCNDLYPIPEGTEDIFLSGTFKYDFSTGSAFRFDGVASLETIMHRQQTEKKGLTLLVVFVIIGFILGILKAVFLN